MIDAKSDEKSVGEVIEKIRKLTENPITYVVSTHSDGDHVSGNKYFRKSATFISHENCRKEILLPGRNGAPSEWSRPELAAFVPSITFRGKMDLYLGSKKIELWHFGTGHTTGDIVVYFPDEKIAFVGDQIMFGRPQLIHSYKGAIRSDMLKI